jgi:hypothetical protein
MFYACLGPFVIFVQCKFMLCYNLFSSIVIICVKMYWLMLVLLLTRSVYQSNWFPTPVRPVCLQEVKTVRLVVRTSQTGIVLLPILCLFSCVSSPAICITYTSMTLSHLLAPHKLRDIGGVPRFLLNMCKWHV